MSSCKKKNPCLLVIADWTQHRRFKLNQACHGWLNVSLLTVQYLKSQMVWQCINWSSIIWLACPVSYKPVLTKVVITTHNVADKNMKAYQLTGPSCCAAGTQGSPVDSDRTWLSKRRSAFPVCSSASSCPPRTPLYSCTRLEMGGWGGVEMSHLSQLFMG